MAGNGPRVQAWLEKDLEPSHGWKWTWSTAKAGLSLDSGVQSHGNGT